MNGLFDPNHKILNYDDAKRKSEILKSKGHRILFVSGVFDLMHVAHVMYLTKIKQLGGLLFVSLGSDETVTALKGPTRPILNENLRAGMLAALEVVDYVIIANEEKVQLPSRIDYELLFSKIKPDVLAVNDFDTSIPQKKELAMQYGADLEIIDCSEHRFISTSEIENRIYKIGKKNA